MARRRTPHLRDGATALEVVIRPRVWEGPEDTYAVTLHPHKFGDDRWEVYLPNGDLTSRWIGTVGRYVGSLDRKIAGTRLRRPGKRRTLWSEQGPAADDRTEHHYTSRADAIRVLVRADERSRR